MSADIHAKIAAKVYPDERAYIAHPAFVDAPTCFAEGRLFNLLETDSNGNPTQQAKASSFDVLDWLIKIGPKDKGYGWVELGHKVLTSEHPNACVPIYEAAKEII